GAALGYARPPRRRARARRARRWRGGTMARSLITFTSDFGLDDWFVGVVHGVIEQLCPEARVIDLTHSIPPGHIERAAFVLRAAGVTLPSFAPQITDAQRLPAPLSRRENGALAGRIQLIDRFGNALTNLHAEEIALAFPGVPERELEVRIAGRRIQGIGHTYG